jgi:plasmid stability protein
MLGSILELNRNHADESVDQNAPDHIVTRLRERARRHHRSLQGELLAIIESAALEDQPSTAAEVLLEVRRLGLETPGEAASIVRASRDRR